MRKKKILLRDIATDFLIGGFLVALALYIGSSLGAIFGGIVAALPIRVGVTIFLAGVRNERFASEMVEGALLTYLGTLFFLLSLWYFMPKIGLYKSFALALAISGIVIFLTFKLAGKI